MPENEGKQTPREKSVLRIKTFTRRQFLKHAVVAAAGVAIATLPAACKSPGSTTPPTTSTTSPGTTSPATSTTPTSSSTTPTSSSTAPTSSSTTPPTNTVVTSYNYIPSTAAPPLKPVPGSDCVVATDRSYTSDYLWVLSLPNTSNIAVMGISSTLVEMLGEPHKISLSPVGTPLSAGDTFGSIEGFKMATDLVTPVSGMIVEIDDYLVAQSSDLGVIEQVNDDPYRSGWMVVLQLSKPAELGALLTSQQYINLLAKK